MLSNRSLSRKRAILALLLSLLLIPSTGVFAKDLYTSFSSKIESTFALLDLHDPHPLGYNPKGEIVSSFFVHTYFSLLYKDLIFQASPYLRFESSEPVSLLFEELFLQFSQNDWEIALGKKEFYWDIGLSRQYTFLDKDVKPYLDRSIQSYYTLKGDYYPTSYLSLSTGTSVSLKRNSSTSNFQVELLSSDFSLDLEPPEKTNFWFNSNFLVSPFTINLFYIYSHFYEERRDFSNQFAYEVIFDWEGSLFYTSGYAEVDRGGETIFSTLLGWRHTLFFSSRYLASLSLTAEGYWEDNQANIFLFTDFQDLFFPDLGVQLSYTVAGLAHPIEEIAHYFQSEIRYSRNGVENSIGLSTQIKEKVAYEPNYTLYYKLSIIP